MIWTLLILFQIKHFLADYILQTPYMLGKFKEKDWALPLAAHCGVHLFFTFLISLHFLYPEYEYIKGDYNGDFAVILSMLLGVIDFLVHFIMDRIKASPKLLGRFEAISKDQYRGLVESRSMCVQAYSLFSGSPAEATATEAERKIKEIDQKFKSNTYFWYSLGLDQMIHHLTDIAIIYILVTYA